jgi:hypothetical protein
VLVSCRGEHVFEHVAEKIAGRRRSSREFFAIRGIDGLRQRLLSGVLDFVEDRASRRVKSAPRIGWDSRGSSGGIGTIRGTATSA